MLWRNSRPMFILENEPHLFYHFCHFYYIRVVFLLRVLLNVSPFSGMDAKYGGGEERCYGRHHILFIFRYRNLCINGYVYQSTVAPPHILPLEKILDTSLQRA